MLVEFFVLHSRLQSPNFLHAPLKTRIDQFSRVKCHQSFARPLKCDSLRLTWSSKKSASTRNNNESNIMKRLCSVLFLGAYLGIGCVAVAQEPQSTGSDTTLPTPEPAKPDAEAPVEPPQENKGASNAARQNASAQPMAAVSGTTASCPCAETCLSDAADGLEVKEVWIKNPSKPIAEKGAQFAALSKADRDRIAELEDLLQRCQDARKCREELATARATIRLEKLSACDDSKPVLWKLSSFDLVGSDSIDVIDANHGLIVNWEPINPNCKKEATTGLSSNDSFTQASQGTGDQSSDPPVDNPEARDPKSSVVPMAREAQSDKESGLNKIFRSGGVIAMSESQLYTINPPLADQSSEIDSFSLDAPVPGASPSKAFLSGDVEWFTYRQRSLPWKISYEIDGDSLLQWVEFGNFSAYQWKCGTRIHLLDSELPANSISFELRQDVCVGKAAIQLLSVRKITSRTWTYEMETYQTETTINPSQSLTFESMENIDLSNPVPVRGTFKGVWYSGNLARVEGQKDTARWESSPGPKGTVSKPKESNLKLIGLELGIFQVSGEASREITTGDFDPSTIDQKVVLNVKSTPGWKLPEGSPWTLNPKKTHYILEIPLMAQELSIPPVVEIRSRNNPQELDFYEPEDKKKLLLLLKVALEQGDTSDLVKILNRIVILQEEIAANDEELTDLVNSIGELNKRYEKTDPLRQNRILLIHLEIERLKAEERSRTSLILSENAQKEAEIANLLEPVH